MGLLKDTSPIHIMMRRSRKRSLKSMTYNLPPTRMDRHCKSAEVHCSSIVDGFHGRIVRMSTFRQAINLSAEWDGAYLADEEVQNFLDSVADLILSLTRD